MTARRRALDRIRRTAKLDDRLRTIAADPSVDHDAVAGPLVDEQLALLCGCCHPALGIDAQVALTLRAVGGLSTAQIAHAFLVPQATMERRLTRAKAKITAANVPFGVPDRQRLVERLAAVCHVVHLIFTEGHTSATTASLVRGDLCDEAAWLADLLAHLAPDDPEVLGLAALIHLTDARRATRLDADGALVTLEHQDRSQWDATRVARGLALLGAAHARRSSGPYQLQAAIAALHTTAPSFAETDWAAIVALYDVLLTHDPSPVVALNRAIAVSYVEGPVAGLAAIDALVADDDGRASLAGYHYVHSARGELLLRLTDDERPLPRADPAGAAAGHRTSEHGAAAVAAFEAAIAACGNDAERQHLRRRLRVAAESVATFGVDEHPRRRQD